MPCPKYPRFKILDELPDYLVVDVDCYDEEHRVKLSGNGYPPAVQSIAGTTIKIPSADFLAYFLFRKQRFRPDLYSQLKAVKKAHLYEAAAELEHLVALRDGTIAIEDGVVKADSTLTGRIGEAVSLCAINQIHDTGPGDWLALPEGVDEIPRGLRPCDFRIQTASDGKKVIQVEAKGSFARESVDFKSKAVRAHASDILRKKETHAVVPEAKSGIWHADLRYGTITVFGDLTKGTARCWLLDPPAEGNGDSYRLRVIARMLHATNLLQLLAPRSQLTIAVVNRVASVLLGENIAQFDGRPVLRQNGESFSDVVEGAAEMGTSRTKFSANRTQVRGHPVVGAIFKSRRMPFLFVGIEENLLKAIVDQELDALSSYATKPRVFEGLVDAVMPTGSAKEMGFPDVLSGPYFRKVFRGRLFSSSSGVVFGQVEPL